MAILATGNTFAVGDELTHTKLNNAVNNATFDTGAVDNATTQLSGGALIVRDGGISPAKLSSGGPSWTGGGALTATSIQSTPIGSTAPSSGAFTTLSASGTTSIYETVEKATISGSALTGTVVYNWLDGAVVLYTANAAGNWTLNVQGSSSITLNNSLATGDSITLAVLATQGSTAYYQSAMQIDGVSVTPKWVNGPTAPSAGNINSIDVYTFTIIKTADAAFTVLASQTKFA